MNYKVLILFLLALQVFPQENKTIITGFVTSSSSMLPIKDVNVKIEGTSHGTTTDSKGFYSIQVNQGNYLLSFSCVGFENHEQLIKLYPNKKIEINISLTPRVYEINEISIQGNKTPESITVQEIKGNDLISMPNLYSDVIRGVKILPGVTSNNELTSAYNVRGGNFDENLIYLNGYEIYRPLLSEQGVEESQSIVNQNMVGDLRFYNGAFPAKFDDKMSSVLEIGYKKNFDSTIHGNLDVNLLNMGLTINKRVFNFNITGGIRYANPASFANVLQTSGQYRPKFIDFQFFATYNFSESSGLELFYLQAYNKFDLTPENWEGQFQLSRVDIRQITLEYTGKQYYSFNKNIAGIKYFGNIIDKVTFNASFSYYYNNETETKNLSNNIFYSEDAYNPDDNRKYLKTAYELSDNKLNVNTYAINAEVTYTIDNHIIKIGAKGKFSEMNSILNETTYETGPDSILNPSYSTMSNQDVNFNSISGFIEDNISITQNLNANLGVRVLNYYYNNEILISPRLNIDYKLNDNNKLSFGWGYFYQPPYYYELRDKDLTTMKPLKAQKAIHYILSWEKKLNPTSDFLVEVYYKQLNNLIPYYIDQLKLVYSNQNNSDGYAYGVDLQYRGELVKGITSWIGYSYLDTKEKNITNNSGYQRRLLDQTHTIRIYLQDRVKRRKNFQSHVVFNLGSGFLYHPQKTIQDPTTGLYTMTPDYDQVRKFTFYFRVDMGLTFRFTLGKGYELTVIPEVYNVFNKYNIATYSWHHVLPETEQPIPIAHVYSKRFFNIGINLEF